MGLTFSNRRRRRILRARTFGVVGIVVVLAGGIAFVATRGGGPGNSVPDTTVERFLAAWTKGDTAAMSALLDVAPPDLASTTTSLVKSVPDAKATYTRTALTRDKKTKAYTANYHARVDLPGFGPFEWDGSFTPVRVKVAKQNVWRVHWTPDVAYPGLAAGQHLNATRTWQGRAAILAADGSLLAGNQSVVTIGLEPDRVTQSLPQIKELMQQLLLVDPAAIDAALHAPGIKPNYFVPITTVPDDDRYKNELRPKLLPIDGVFFRRTQGVLAAPGLLSAQIVGTVGPVTADRLKQLGPPYRNGDTVGLTGLQATFETRLAGTPSGTVDIDAADNTVVRTVKRFPGKAPQSGQLTIDPHTQQAAEAALSSVAKPAALVAIDTATGQLRAVVSKPDNGFDRALEGTYPPGSTFKLVTTAALLGHGSNGATPAPCPATLTVDGRTFHNFEGEANTNLDLAHAFAQSCNNAFIGLADQLPDDALVGAATALGFNAKWSLPVNSSGGSYPTPKDRAELAASSIGQGRVLASPAQMASVAAAIASGQWRAPALTTQPVATGPTVPALDPNVASQLRSFMAGVVATGGTAAGAGLPAGTLGKTGTAEFGNANPPETHAWFVGYRGTLAFAVIVEGGGVGGQVAAPLAAAFLRAVG